MPAPTIADTGTPYTTLPVQEVTCTVDTVLSGTAQTFDFSARVRAEAPNGAVMEMAGVTVTSPNSPTSQTGPVS